MPFLAIDDDVEIIGETSAIPVPMMVPVYEERYIWPTTQDLNTRLRRVITAYQRNYKKEELRQQQKAKVCAIQLKYFLFRIDFFVQILRRRVKTLGENQTKIVLFFISTVVFALNSNQFAIFTFSAKKNPHKIVHNQRNTSF